LTSFALSTLQPNLIATCSFGDIKVWRVPDEGLENSGDGDDDGMKYCLQTLQAKGKINHLSFHPFIADLLICSTGTSAGVQLELFDLKHTNTNTNNNNAAASNHTTYATKTINIPLPPSASAHNHQLVDFDFHPSENWMVT
jgi:hypothetical protein